MNKAILVALLGGAAAGAIAALLLSPKSGADNREAIKRLCKKYARCRCKGEKEVDRLVDEIAMQIGVAQQSKI